ncbi:MAG: hypothetical protein RLZZ09_1187 [Pseudomonadota bacterium]
MRQDLQVPIKLEIPFIPESLWNPGPLGSLIRIVDPVHFDQPALSLAPDRPQPIPTSFADRVRKGTVQLGFWSGQGCRIMANTDNFSQPSRDLDWCFHAGVSQLLASQGAVFLHACAFLDTDPSGILVVGESGAGKSTWAALDLRQGLKVVSDDCVMATRMTDTPGVEIRSLRGFLNFRQPTPDLLPAELAANLYPVRNTNPREYRLALADHPQYSPVAMPDRLISCRVDRRLAQTRITAIPQPLLLAELIRASSSLFLSARYPQERAGMLPVLMALTRQMRGFRVRLGRDLFRDPDGTFQRLIDSIAN